MADRDKVVQARTFELDHDTMLLVKDIARLIHRNLYECDDYDREAVLFSIRSIHYRLVNKGKIIVSDEVLHNQKRASA